MRTIVEQLSRNKERQNKQIKLQSIIKEISKSEKFIHDELSYQKDMTKEEIDSLIAKSRFSKKRVLFLESENERLKAEREWISVKSKMPDETHENVLVSTLNGAMGVINKFLLTRSQDLYWMPLPNKPPKQ